MAVPFDHPLLLLAAAFGVGLLVIVVIAFVLVQLFSKPKQKAKEPPKTLYDFAAQPPLPPDMSRPHVEIYGTPMRVLLVLLAPVGRTSQLPVDGQHRQVLEGIDHQLADVVTRDGANVERWPAQLSAAGFCQAFFNQTAMPGKGKGTPWCAAAGKVDNFGTPILVGMIFVAAEPNGLGEILVEHEGKWRDVLRVKSAK